MKGFRSILWLSAVFLLCFFSLPRLVQADSLPAKPPLEQIDQAIVDQEHDWITRDYGDALHALGLLDEALDALPEDDGEPLVSLAEGAELPAGLDWRDHGGNYVSPVKYQASCGSCWSFAAVAALESHYAISMTTPGTFLDLSEQLQVSCDTRNLGCSGGWNSYAALFLIEQGVPPESCYPYIAKSGSEAPCSNACSDWSSQAVHLAAYERVEQSVQGLKEALQYGPVVVAYDVYNDFDAYGGGVYEYTWGDRRGGHAVLLVGYQDVAGQYGGGYFIVKNSWDTWFGESGFFRIGYSQVTEGPVDFGRSAYLYHATLPTPDAYEPDDDNTTASILQANTPQSHSLSGPGDSDWVQFTLSDSADITLETYGLRGGDTTLYLYSSSMQLLAADYSSGQGSYALLSTQLPAGTYYAQVFMYDSSLILSDYTLQLSLPPYQASSTWIDTFGTQAGGWTSQDRYPRILGDVNEDGLDDIVAFGESAVSVALSTGSSFAAKSIWLERSLCGVTGWTSMDTYPRILGDVNGDGRDDIVGFGYNRVFVALANSSGDGFEPQQVWLENSLCKVKGWNSWNVYPRLMGDLNGDGRDDVVGFGYMAICVALANDTGDGFEPQQVWLWDSLCRIKGWSSQSVYPRLLADVNGDNLVDIVGFGQEAICVTPSTGSELAPQEIWMWNGLTRNVGWESQDAYPRLVADANGDGLADVIGFGDQHVCGALSNGSTFDAICDWNSGAFTPATGWSSQDTYPRMMAQVGGDAGADIVGFGAEGASVSLAQW